MERGFCSCSGVVLDSSVAPWMSLLMHSGSNSGRAASPGKSHSCSLLSLCITMSPISNLIKDFATFSRKGRCQVLCFSSYFWGFFLFF